MRKYTFRFPTNKFSFSTGGKLVFFSLLLSHLWVDEEAEGEGDGAAEAAVHHHELEKRNIFLKNDIFCIILWETYLVDDLKLVQPVVVCYGG